MSFHVPNKRRIRTGRLASEDSIGNAGAFEIKLRYIEADAMLKARKS